MKSAVIFITGTDTGVGKTVFASLLTRHLRAGGRRVAALKPICAGGREDAQSLRRAQEDALTLDEINPWHFRAPLAPVLAARLERRKVKMAEVMNHIRRIRRRFATVVVEGAGGLLSPLGEDFDARSLMQRARAVPVIVCPNRLGAINQARLVLAALPAALARRAQVVLMANGRADAASRTNPALLAAQFDPKRIHVLPRLRRFSGRAGPAPAVRRALQSLTVQLEKSR